MRRRLFVLACLNLGAGLLLLPSASLASNQHANIHGGSGVISVTGRVGPLVLGESTAVDVQRFAGSADYIGTGTYEVPGIPAFVALGYDCSPKRGLTRIDPTAYQPSHTYCRTVFDINTKTRTLGAFWTSSPAYRTTYGTRPGSRQSFANEHEDALPDFGCHRGLSSSSAVADLLMDNRGGHPIESTQSGVTKVVAVEGGAVNDFALEAVRGGVGLLFC